MKNLSTCKVITLLVFTSCTSKTIVRDAPMLNGTWFIERDIQKNISTKKTGTFQYPNLGTEYKLRKGKFNGVFKIIVNNNDTVFYCNFDNNLPVGKYILKSLNDYPRHHRTIPRHPNLYYGIGEGTFNKEHKKEGLWKLGYSREEFYKNGEVLSE